MCVSLSFFKCFGCHFWLFCFSFVFGGPAGGKNHHCGRSGTAGGDPSNANSGGGGGGHHNNSEVGDDALSGLGGLNDDKISGGPGLNERELWSLHRAVPGLRRHDPRTSTIRQHYYPEVCTIFYPQHNNNNIITHTHTHTQCDTFYDYSTSQTLPREKQPNEMRFMSSFSYLINGRVVALHYDRIMHE